MALLGKKVQKYPALFIEGGDSVGKNELVKNIAKYILLANPNQKILLMNFPQFWFFGHDIRLVIRGASDELLLEMDGVENTYLRSSLYAIDRNIALMLAESYIAKNPGVFVLSDRGPYSSCNTIGYLQAEGKITEKDIRDRIIPDMFTFADEGMLTFFDATFLLCSPGGEFTLGKRKALDKYEAELPQKFSAVAYKSLGIPEVIMKNNNSWRSRLVLVKEALQQTNNQKFLNEKVTEEELINEKILIDAYKNGRVILVGPELFIRHFRAEGIIDAKLRKLLDKWLELSLGGDVAGVKDRKELLDGLETKIAIKLKRNTKHFDYLSALKSSQAQQSIKKLFLAYPIMKEILQKTSGSHMATFFNGLFGFEQL
ncbi:hypothetical protein IT418_01355 [bacterium]|nr:hypothetical protein [bacterium]